MSEANPGSVESTPIEKLMQQLQTTFTQFWQRISTGDDADTKEPDVKPVVILGKTYENGDVRSKEIASAIYSRIWFTYRAGFEPIERAEDGPGPLTFLRSVIINSMTNNAFAGLLNNKAFSSDVGWGCMIRTSQSLLANALQAVVLGKDYEHDSTSIQKKHEDILDLFQDSYDHPLSLQNFIRAASELPLQVKPGEWFGPSAASLSIKRLCSTLKGDVPKLNVFVSESSDLYEDEMKAVFEKDASPLLILFPIRLGIDKINAIYYPSLLQLLSMKQSVGIAGGKPSSSYYFFGHQGSQLLYLDPHHLQAVTDDSSTYHTSRCQMLPISDLDPSMVVGILIKDHDEFLSFKSQLTGTNIIIHVHDRQGSLRRKSMSALDARRDSEFVKVSSSDFQRPEDIGDFTDIGDEFTDDGDDLDQSFVEVSEPSQSFSKYDIVERPGSVSATDNNNPAGQDA